MRVNVKNKTVNAITVPLTSLVPGCAMVQENAEPEASATCVFRQTDNEPVQTAIVDWAAGIAIEISFMPEPFPVPSPVPPAPTPPPVFDPQNPLGI